MTFKESCEKLETKIEASYTEGVTLEEAEKLAGEFLGAQLKVSAELKKVDLDRRMKKTGVKAVRAAIRLDILQKNESKKPTEATIEAMIDTDSIVRGEQDSFDTAEVDKEELQRIFDVFSNAHVHFRTIAKGKFE